MKTPFTYTAAAALTVALAGSGQVIAQQQQGSQPPPQGGASAQAGGQTSAQGGADVQVREQPAQIQVEQEQPDVTVRQPAPDVSITQPEPKVQVRQAQPDVTVEEAQPQVTVTSPGQPEVRVEQTEQPTVRYERVETPQQTTQQQSQGQAQVRIIESQGGSQGQSQQLMSMTAEQLEDKQLKDQQGTDLGSIDKVVKEQGSNKLHVLVKVGGVMGIGADQIAIPLDQLSMQGENLTAPINAQDQGLAQRYAYDQNRFTELEQKNAQLSQAAGGGGDMPSFQQLDQDRDGYLTQQDVQQYDQIKNRWQQIDRNSDQRVDRAEFSAFEAQSRQGNQQGSQQQPPPGGSQSQSR